MFGNNCRITCVNLLLTFLNFIVFCSSYQRKPHYIEDIGVRSHPSVVSVRGNGIHYCTGTILNHKHVLTSADCICNFNSSEWQNVTVTTSVNFNNENGPCFGLKDVYCHPLYKTEHESNDSVNIAVLKIDGYFKYNSLQRRVRFSRKDVSVFGARQCYFVGWNNTQPNSVVHLQKYTFDIASKYKCGRMMSKVEKDIDKNKIACGIKQFSFHHSPWESFGSGAFCRGRLIGIFDFEVTLKKESQSFYVIRRIHPEGEYISNFFNKPKLGYKSR